MVKRWLLQKRDKDTCDKYGLIKVHKVVKTNDWQLHLDAHTAFLWLAGDWSGDVSGDPVIWLGHKVVRSLK